MSTRLKVRVIDKAASYTISPAKGDAAGTVYTNKGALGSITFTLPSPNQATLGDYYDFRVQDDQSVVVAAPTVNTLVTLDDATADNVGFQISGKKVGRGLRAVCTGSISGTCYWHAHPLGALDGFCVDGSEYPFEIGAVKTDDITGTDSSLGITGQAAAQGGAVVVTGGASSTATNAGGAVTLKGGTGNTSGAGGEALVTGGTGGATGVGGQVTVTGGTPIDAAGGAVVIAGGAGVGTNRAGGLASVTGGAAVGTGIGGVASLVGGVGGTGGATGAGGAAKVTGGASAATNADGGGVVLGGGAKNGGGFVGPVVLGNAQLTPIWYPQAAPAADGADTPITMTVAQMIAGIVSMTPTTGRTVTTPTGAQMDAGVAFADVPATFGFDFSVQNRAAFAATDDILTLTAGATGATVTGSAVVSPGSTARFRAVRTAASTWIFYKIAG